jgi:hypothetical protein
MERSQLMDNSAIPETVLFCEKQVERPADGLRSPTSKISSSNLIERQLIWSSRKPDDWEILVYKQGEVWDACFFRCHNTKTHELKRYAINPNSYAALDDVAPEEAMDEPQRREPVTPEMIEALLAPIRSIREGREDIARQAFLTLYYRYGLSLAEIKVHWNTLGRDVSTRKKFDRYVALVRRNEKTGYVFRG